MKMLLLSLFIFGTSTVDASECRHLCRAEFRSCMKEQIESAHESKIGASREVKDGVDALLRTSKSACRYMIKECFDDCRNPSKKDVSQTSDEEYGFDSEAP